MKKMPVLFVGHGSPMNAIEDNEYSRTWSRIAQEIPRPEAILAVSAHWYTEGTRVTDAVHPAMIYDMYGFPDALYQVKYPAKGAPELAHTTKELITRDVQMDNSWGYDHGAWSVLSRMYPKADIPVYQLSVDRTASAADLFKIGQEIAALREKGVLILGSGNVVHNLSMVDWDMDGGYDWAEAFRKYINGAIEKRQYGDAVNYRKAGKSAELAVRWPDHFDPLLYVLGAASEADRVSLFNDVCMMGSMSMTCYLFQS